MTRRVLVLLALPAGRGDEVQTPPAEFAGGEAAGVTRFARLEQRYRSADEFPAHLEYLHTERDGDLRIKAGGRESGEVLSVDWLYRRVTDLEAP